MGVVASWVGHGDELAQLLTYQSEWEVVIFKILAYQIEWEVLIFEIRTYQIEWEVLKFDFLLIETYVFFDMSTKYKSKRICF